MARFNYQLIGITGDRPTSSVTPQNVISKFQTVKNSPEPETKCLKQKAGLEGGKAYLKES